jgi:branched-chain amino acid transport system substrate-binding protein
LAEGERERAQRSLIREETLKHCSRGLLVMSMCVATVISSPSFGQKKYDPGANDSEIKIGNIMPYSGPLSAYSSVGKAEAAYFNKINVEGGVNGRKINFISVDDGYSPPKTVEQARKLVENDEVLFIFQSLGTPTNIAIEKYLNDRKVPQLFVSSGATRFGDPKSFPWTMGWQPTFQTEGRIFAQYLLQNYPNAKIGVLYQNDDSGKEYLKGFKDGLNGRIQIVAEAPYEVSEPTVDSQIVTIKNHGVDVLFIEAAPKFAAQAIRRVAELNWKPVELLASVSNSVGAVLKPAGFENAKGILSAGYLKDPTDPRWKDDLAVKTWEAFMVKYYPGGDRTSVIPVFGYVLSQTLVQVLKQCGDDLTRENVMRQAANLKDLELDMLLPGIKINTSPTDYYPIEQMQMTRFNGEYTELFGPMMSGAIGGN